MSTHATISRISRVLVVTLAAVLPVSGVGVLRGDNQFAGGCQWEIVPSASPAFDALYGVTALASNDVWAVGTSERYPSPVQPLIEHWDGATWSIVDSPALPGPSGLFAIDAASPKDIWAIGQFNPNSALGTLIEHWDGTTWSIVQSPDPGAGNGLPQAQLIGIDAVSSNDVWIVGKSFNTFGRVEGFVMHWDGVAWSLAPTPDLEQNSGFSSVLALAPNDVWVVGGIRDSVSGGILPLIEHWDGDSWTVIPSPPMASYSDLGALSAVSPRDIWASGTYRPPQGGYQPFFEHWDGNAWSPVAAESQGYGAFLRPVAVGPNNVWAVGYSVSSSGSDRQSTLIEHWDGSRWSIVPSPNSNAPSSRLNAAAAHSDKDVWAVGGDFTPGSPFSTAKTLIEHCTSTGGLKRPS